MRYEARWGTVCDGRGWASLSDHIDQNWLRRPSDLKYGFKGRLHGGFVTLHERFCRSDPSIVIALACEPDVGAVDRRSCVQCSRNIGAQGAVETLGQTHGIFGHGEGVRNADEVLVKNHVALEDVVVGIDR